MKAMKKLKFILPLLLLTFVFGCKDSESIPMSAEAPRISVKLVDAPGDFEAVNVEIVDVMIKMDDDSDSDEGWMSLEAEGGEVNLLDFTGGFSKVLVDRFPIPAGTLSQMRLVLGDGNTIKFEGDEVLYDLKTPSAQQSGLKVKIDAVVEEGFTYDYVLDFDVDKSIVMAGNSENTILKPVLHASAEVSSGIIEGVVGPAEALPAVASVLVNDMGTPETEDDVVISTTTNETGAFMLEAVPAGDYSLSIDAEGYVSQTVDVTVTPGDDTPVADVTLVLVEA